MPNKKDSLIFDESLRFFGSITASLSHEINNVLAIINELSGLMDDFLMADGGDSPLDPEKQREILGRISAQVGRGIGYVKQLNSFAHSSDNPEETVDVLVSFEQITTLCQRFAKLRNVELNISLPEKTPSLQGSSFMFQHAVFRSIEIALITSNRGDSIVAGLEDTGEGVSIRVKNQSVFEATPEVEDKLSALIELAGKLGGELESPPLSGKPMEFTIHLPALLLRDR